MRNILFAWLGNTDINASRSLSDVGLGPIANAFSKYSFTDVVILSNQAPSDVKAYIQWLKAKTSATIYNYHFALTGPTEYGEIYEATFSCSGETLKGNTGEEDY